MDRWTMHAHLTGVLLATQDYPDLVATQRSADQILDSAAKAKPGEVVVEQLDNGRAVVVSVERGK